MTYNYVMLKNYNKWKIAKLFFSFPSRTFEIREISRLVLIAPLSVKNYLLKLTQDKIIKTSIISNRKYESYTANIDNLNYKRYKQIHNKILIEESGLIEYLDEIIAPDSIVLFGSFFLGENVENSDVDLFVQAKEEIIDLSKFERKLGFKIHLIFSEKIADLPENLMKNILNVII